MGQIPLYLIVLLALTLIVGLAGHFGAAELVTELKKAFSENYRTAKIIFLRWWLKHGVVMAKRLVWPVVGLLALGSVSFVASVMQEKDLGPMPMVYLSLGHLVLCSGLVYWLVKYYWRAKRSKFSPTGLLNASFASLLAMGAVTFVIGQSVSSRRITIVGVVYLLLARSILFWASKVAVWAAAQGIAATEGTNNILITMVRELLLNGKDELKKVVNINIANEEKFEPKRKKWQKRLTLETDSLFLIGILLPSMTVMGFLGIISPMLYSVHWRTLKGVGLKDEAKRYKQVSARGFLLLITVLYVVAAFQTFLPEVFERTFGVLLSYGKAVLNALVGSNVLANGQQVHQAGSLEHLFSYLVQILAQPKLLLATIAVIVGFVFIRKAGPAAAVEEAITVEAKTPWVFRLFSSKTVKKTAARKYEDRPLNRWAALLVLLSSLYLVFTLFTMSVVDWAKKQNWVFTFTPNAGATTSSSSFPSLGVTKSVPPIPHLDPTSVPAPEPMPTTVKQPITQNDVDASWAVLCKQSPELKRCQRK